MIYAYRDQIFFFFKQKTAYEFSACLVGSGEGHALPYQPVGHIRRERETAGGELGQPLGMEAQGAHHARDRGQQNRQLVERVEDRLLVLLEIAVVRERQALERRQEAAEVAEQPPCLAAGQLRDIR